MDTGRNRDVRVNDEQSKTPVVNCIRSGNILEHVKISRKESAAGSLSKNIISQDFTESENIDTPRPRNFNEIVDSGREGEIPNVTEQIPSTSSRRLHHNLWHFLKNSCSMQAEAETQISTLADVPQNSTSNILKMIILPILLMVISIIMVPHFKDLALQTYSAIFFNNKLPDNRGAMLKRLSVGVSLIFDHVIKKMFPVVRLRWANRKLFKRRAEQILPPVSPAGLQ